MTVLNLPRDAAIAAQFRALHSVVGAAASDDAVSSTMTTLMRHGGLYTLLDSDVMVGRVVGLLEAGRSPGAKVAITGNGSATQGLSTPDAVASFVATVQGRLTNFFTHLVAATPCPTPVSLMSYLTFPHEGQTFTEGDDEDDHPKRFESPDVPAPFTFVGQFVDHDLTMNAVNLVDPQAGTVEDNASPLIDLDSVYGPRDKLTSPTSEIFDGAKFRLTEVDGVFDVPRKASSMGDGLRPAVIADARNDENQLILQIHLLVQRMHNKFVDQGLDFDEAKRRTILNWQSMLLHDYLPRITQASVLADVLTNLATEPFGNLKHKPAKDLATGRYLVAMPHEFAIGFRMGHSQLRRAYKLNAGDAVRLFDLSLGTADLPPAGFADLRGSQDLVAAHQIDWDVFLRGPDFTRSNAIDQHVTSAVFDLPESAIPDDIKFIGNLTHRNLIRSRQLGLCSGEDLATFYGFTPLTPEQVEPDATKRHLFSEGGTFRTPLWYYLLKEAQVAAGVGPDPEDPPNPPNPRTLGPTGSRLVCEVVAGGVRYAPLNPWTAEGAPTDWSLASGEDPLFVKLEDIVDFVNPPTP